MFRRVFLIVFLLASALPAAAQQPSPSPSEPPQAQMLRVARISPWLDATHPFAATVQITNTTELALENVRIIVRVFGRVFSRSELELALDHGATTPLIGFASQSLEGSMVAGEQREVEFTRDTAKLAPFSRTGVYPIQITLRSSAGSEYALSAEPYLSAPAERPINISVVLPVTRPTLQRGDGVFPSSAPEDVGANEITQQMSSIAAHPGLAITLAPSPSLLDTLAQMADGFAVHDASTVRVEEKAGSAAHAAATALDAIKRAAAAAGEIATVPYAAADLPSLLQHGLRADLLRQVTLGRSVASERLGRAPSLAALVAPGSRLDEQTIQALLPLGVSAVVTTVRSLDQVPQTPFQPQNFGPSRPVSLDLSGSKDIPALLADDPLSARAAAPEQGVLGGQAFVAMSATAWLELPLFSADRVVVVAPETLPAPPALGAMLDGLAGAPWVHLRTVADAVTALPPQSSASLARIQTADDDVLAAARAARRALNTLEQIVTAPPPEIETLDRTVLLAESSEWRDAPGVGLALGRAVSQRVRAITRAIRVVPRQVTLTSRRGSVPVTITNGNDFPLSVRVRLESSKVEFPGGAARTVELTPPNQTVDFAIVARATGAFPIDVRVESTDGKHRLAAGRVQVRSTAVSAVALVAVGGGVALLLFGSMRRGRRRKASPSR